MRTFLRRDLTLLALLLSPSVLASQSVTTPQEFFGHEIGADYQLPGYSQLSEYWSILASESPRMVLEEFGRTSEGRSQLMAIVTSPENHAGLPRFREISRRLALAEDISDDEARAMAREGRAVVWIDGGLHGSEVLGAQQLMETVYQMVSRSDDETLRILSEVIILFVHANPDGHELVADWYMRQADPSKRTTGGLPRLYHKYAGHDNNRDSYMVSQVETENMARVLYIDWIPQIMYNHHQVGPNGAVMWAPPFRYPANYNLDPLVLAGIEQVGMAMQSRFLFEGKPGVTMREGGPFSTWWNGGLRTTAYFHNIIGLLTETQGNPTPIDIAFVPSRILPDGDYLLPITPQKWHFRQSVDYSVTANRAVLDYASRFREQLLLNIWRAGKNQVEAGSRDSWTITPKRMDALSRVLEENDATEVFVGPQTGALAGYFSLGSPARFFSELRRPEDRNPRGYVIPSNQADFPTATKFVNTLIKNGVSVHRATDEFRVGDQVYPRDSWVVKTAQAFRPHILDMFEPQDHPNDFRYEGGPPVAPYDNAGYTLAYQMGVEFVRILEGFEGPLEKVTGLAAPPPREIEGAGEGLGFLLSHAERDVAIVTNRLLAEGREVRWLKEPVSVGGEVWPPGTVYVPAYPGSEGDLGSWARELGVRVVGIPSRPSADSMVLGKVRVGLWDEYGGSAPSGWLRFILDQFEFPYEVVYPRSLNAGALEDRFDALIFVTDAIPATDGEGWDYEIFGAPPEDVPQEYQAMLGEVTVRETVPLLLDFLRAGGTILTIGTSTSLAYHAGLSVSDHLVDGAGNPLGEAEYYVPGSVLRVRVDNSRPIAWGLPEETDVFFNNSPVLRLEPATAERAVTPVAWFPSTAPLRSGWAWGQHRLRGGAAMAEARVGDGHLYLFGPEITNRGQPHGTFTFLFNGIFLAGAQ